MQRTKDSTTAVLPVTNPGWVLNTAGYKMHRRGNGFIRPDGENRFHAFPNGDKIELHYDKVMIDGKHSSILYDIVFEEINRLSRINHNGDEGKADKCARAVFWERDTLFLLSKVNQRPRWIPRFLYRGMLKLILNLDG